MKSSPLGVFRTNILISLRGNMDLDHLVTEMLESEKLETEIMNFTTIKR